MTADLPADAVDRVEELTRRAREAVDDAEADAYREERAALLAEHGYVARVRSEDTRDVLVLHPEEWVEDGRVQVERVEDVDRGVEVPLSGPGLADDWEAVEEHNRALADRVEREHGAVHGANAHAFADFAGNHYAKRVEDVTPAEVREFLEEYFPRNAFPSDEQRAAVGASVRHVFEAAGAEPPLGG